MDNYFSGLLNKIKRKLLRHKLMSPLSPILYKMGFFRWSIRLSKYSGFCPKILSEEIFLDKNNQNNISHGTMTKPKMKIIAEHNGVIDPISKQIWLGGGFLQYEKPLPKLWLSLTENCEIVFDIGANSGLYSILSAIHNSKVMVYAFEPFPEALSWLKINLDINNLADQVKIVPLALSNKVGSSKLYIPAKKFGAVLESSASLNPNFRTEHDQVLDIEITTIDQYVSEMNISDIDVIKIDVESQEHLVLEGALKVLKFMRPVIFIEVLKEANFESLEKIARENNYVSLYINGSTIKKQEKVFYSPDNYNQILCPKEKLDIICQIWKNNNIPLDI